MRTKECCVQLKRARKYGEIFVSSFDNKNWNSSRAYLRNQTCKKVFRSVERQFQMMKIIAL